MALQFIDKSQAVAWIIDAWQKELGTEMDPADGRWFTNGPGNTRTGLFGGLTDTLATELIFEESSKIFTPHQKAAVGGTVDNRNGLTPKQTLQLLYKYSSATTSTHATSSSIKTGISEQIGVSVKFVESKTTFSVEYTYSWNDSWSEQKGEEISETASIPVEVPRGRVYQVRLLFNTDILTIPYRALVYLSGKSEANFPGPVRGKKHWDVDAGKLCMWINQYGSAGEQSAQFGADRKKPDKGYFALRGTVTATNTGNFVAQTVDITDSYTGDKDAIDAKGKVVATRPLPWHRGRATGP
jgi:hypothetical protein